MLSHQGLENQREEYFQLIYSKGSWNERDLDEMPVYKRKWYYWRLVQQWEAEQKAHEEAMAKAKARR